MSGSARVLSGDLALPVEAPTALVERYVPWLSPTFGDPRTEEDRDCMELWRSPSLSDGRSILRKGGEDAKRAQICSSAVCMSGEPMSAFCWSEIP